ncbi:MAG: ribosome maturation factor RimM [Bacilli bacterium]
MEYVYVGRINGTHGLKGELKLKSDFLYKDKILNNGFNFFVGNDKKHVILERIRHHNGVELVTFKDLEDINLVEDLKNSNLYILKEDLSLSENEYVFEDYLGLDCYFNNENIGKVIDIVNCGSNNYVFYITGKKEVLIPVNDKFIDKVILKNKIIFKEVEGLIDAN